MAKRSCTLVVALFVLVVAQLACGGSGGGEIFKFPTPTPPYTQTPIFVQITTTPVYTYTSVVKIVTETPQPKYFCVSADEAVNLRPSPSDDNYPIKSLRNGDRVLDLGGKSGLWIFVQTEDEQGWINSEFLGKC